MKIKEGGGMDIKNTIISAKVVIESLVALLENEDVDISSIKFKVGSQEEGYESEDMSFESLINLTMKGLEEAKAQAVPEVITIGNELQSWVAVWSFRAKNDGEDYVVVDANLLAEKIEKLTGANA